MFQKKHFKTFQGKTRNQYCVSAFFKGNIPRVLLEFLPPLVYDRSETRGVKTPGILKMLDFDQKNSRLRRENPIFGVFKP